MGETRNGMSEHKNGLKRSGTSYGQRPGRWAETKVDELVWGRQRMVCQDRKMDQEKWDEYGQRPGRWAVSRINKLVWERKLEER